MAVLASLRLSLCSLLWGLTLSKYLVFYLRLFVFLCKQQISLYNALFQGNHGEPLQAPFLTVFS